MSVSQSYADEGNLNAGNSSSSVDGRDVDSDQMLDEVVGRLTSPNKNSKNNFGEVTSSNLKWADAAVEDNMLLENNIILPKDKRGLPGSKEYKSAYAAATESMEVKFGAPHHFVSSRDGEDAEAGNQTENKQVQELLVSNIAKVKAAQLRAEQYDMMAVVQVQSIKNARAKIPSEMFDADETKNLFQHGTSMKCDHILLWQYTINKWGSAEDRQSSKWLQSFLFRSSTQDLRDRVESQYKRLDVKYRGGATYLYFLLRVLFHMSRETVNSLKGFLKRFESKGPGLVRGENVAYLEKQVVGVSTWLEEANALPDETVVDVLTGLGITCFKKPEQSLWSWTTSAKERRWRKSRPSCV